MSEPDEGSFGGLERALTSALVQTTRCAGQLASEDVNFLRTADPELGKALDKQKSRLLATARRLVRTAVIDTDLAAPSLSKVLDLEDEWGPLVDVIDNLLEKADRCLDEYSGAVKAHNVPEATPDHSKVNPSQRPKIENILKPQRLFANPPRNDFPTPFKPLLKTKPHALLSLQESIEPEKQDSSNPDQPLSNASLQLSRGFRHPYELEIKNYRYPPKTYNSSTPVEPIPFESTSATWVDTMDRVHEMLAELKQAEEIAVDLEHHDSRTYIGIVSLMQISTRNKDWIVDTLKPWREELQLLNEVFADPNIIKVFHGAQMDVIWLQRDLGIYIVGLFDTYHASCSLGYTGHSLAFLLKKFVNFDAQKQYQLADWRIRPLSEEMFTYARADTHFLLYVYDNMRNELLSMANGGPSLIDSVLEESKKVALQQFEWPLYDYEYGVGERGWYDMLVRTPALFSKEQFAVFRAVHRWRDQVARKDDESPAYLMPKTTLLNIASDMPSTLPALQAHLTRKIDSVNSRVSELLKVIQETKANGVDGPEMDEFMANHPGLADFQAKREAKKKWFRKSAAAAAAKAQRDDSATDSAKDELPSISGDDLKAGLSLFWGNTIESHTQEDLDLKGTIPFTTQFQVPLPNLSAEVFATNGEAMEEELHAPVPPPEHAYVKRPLEDSDDGEEVFTLKERGGPRRRKPGPATSIQHNQADVGEDIIMNEANFEPLEPGTHKIEIKEEPAEKKHGKRNRKPRQSRENGKQRNGEAVANNEAFDYANAPSVLHATHNSADSRNGKTHALPMNPYAKSSDAPKGLPKKKKEIQGKSATFKS